MLPDVLVEKAFLQRPELQQEAYQYRISTLEAKKALLKIFPSLNFTTGVEYDSNSYKINNTWAETGVRLSWNLMNLFSGPKAIEMAHAQEELALLRRQTMAMSIMTQVYVGYQEYMRTTQLFEKSDKMSILEHEIFLHVKNGAEQKTQTKLELMRTELSSINADLARYKAYSEMQNALASLNLSIGLDALPKTVESHELEPLKEAIGTSMAENTVAVKEQIVTVVQPQLIVEVEKVKEEVKEQTTETVVESKDEIVITVPETVQTDAIAIENEDIHLVLKTWENAWSNNDFEAYKACYSTRFISPDGKSFDAWMKSRKMKVIQNKLITVMLQNIDVVSRTEQEVVVRFHQAYVAAHLNDSTEKTLRLVNENGVWKIVEESVQ
jgi:outer membrane protein TolC